MKHFINYSPKGGRVKAKLVINSKTPAERLRRIVYALLMHLEAQIGTENNPEVFERISAMREDFFCKVLKYMADINLACGKELPQKVREFLTRSSKGWNVDDD